MGGGDVILFNAFVLVTKVLDFFKPIIFQNN